MANGKQFYRTNCIDRLSRCIISSRMILHQIIHNTLQAIQHSGVASQLQKPADLHRLQLAQSSVIGLQFDELDFAAWPHHDSVRHTDIARAHPLIGFTALSFHPVH